jgi:hypothetical protein
MQTLDKHFRSLTQTVFKKHGFAQADLVAQWPAIAGPELAGISIPEKIKWPHGQTEQSGGTLHLKVQAGRGLDVQYAASVIMERVNQFLGFQAVIALKVVQSHTLVVKTAARPPSAPIPPSVLTQVSAVGDPDLQNALARLGAGVLAETPRSPQAK